MIWKNSCLWKYQMLCSSHHVPLLEEVVTQSLQDYSDILTWFGHLIFPTDLWMLFSLLFWKDFCLVQKVLKSLLHQLWSPLWICMQKSEHNCCQLQQSRITLSTWEIWVKFSKVFWKSAMKIYQARKLLSAFGSMKHNVSSMIVLLTKKIVHGSSQCLKDIFRIISKLIGKHKNWKKFCLEISILLEDIAKSKICKPCLKDSKNTWKSTMLKTQENQWTWSSSKMPFYIWVVFAVSWNKIEEMLCSLVSVVLEDKV